MAQNIDWANVLEWGGGGGFKLPSEAEISQSRANWDDFYSLTGKFAPQDQNIDLLRQLGFGGSAVDQQAGEYDFGGSTPRWSNDALQWLDGQGYSVGVGHQPGTKSGGRAEFWGLMGPDGKYVQGQSDPTMSVSDTLMEQIAMMAMVAGPFASAIGTSMAGAGAAGGAAGSLGSTLPTVADYGLNALSSVGTDAAASFLGGGGAVGGAASNVLPSVLTTGTAAGGGSLLPGLLSGGAALGSAWSSPGFTGQSPEMLDRVEVTGSSAPPTQSMLPNAPGAAGLLGQAAPTASLDRVEITGNSTPPPSAEPLVPPLVLPDIPYASNPLPSQGIDKILNQTPTEVREDPTLNGNSMLPDWLKPIGDGIGKVSDLVGGGKNLAGIIGAGLGAASGGGTNTATSQSKMDPRMDQYVYGSGFGDPNSIMGGGYGLWQQNKSGINPTMQQGLDMQRAALTDPAYGGAYTQMRNLGQGLMSQPIAGNPFTNGSGGLLGPQPTAQAGGPGGLLGNDDRMKALMARGRGLIG